MRRPPGPFRRESWTSPARGLWLTSVLGSLLLPSVTIAFLTGIGSHLAYESELGRNATFDRDPVTRGLDRLIDWPAADWLYAVNQGLHVTAGLILFPALLAKLWSVIPKLFEWPPVRNARHGLERASLALLVGSSLFVLATGIINLQYWYPWEFAFVPSHYYAAWVFVAALFVHVAGRIAVARRVIRKGPPARSPVDAGGTITRRGILGVVGAGSSLLALQGIGQSVGGPLRHLALLSPRGAGSAAPGDFQVNKTARRARITPAMTGPDWRLKVTGGARELSLSRADLLKLELVEATLPIACVEGWTATRRWAGIRVADLAAMAGVARPASVLVESLQAGGAFRQVTLNAAQARDPKTLLALQVDGRDLSMDHGFPARLIIPGAPGVHNTKWVASMTVRAA